MLVGYTFVHDGHCNGGWINSNTNQSTIVKCYEQCKANTQCGYFAYDASGKGCALYTLSGGCPDDDSYPSHNSYKMSSGTHSHDQHAHTHTPHEPSIPCLHCARHLGRPFGKFPPPLRNSCQRWRVYFEARAQHMVGPAPREIRTRGMCPVVPFPLRYYLHAIQRPQSPFSSS